MASSNLIHYAAYCTCGASCHARNVMGWAHQHVKKADGQDHAVEVQLGYHVKPTKGSVTNKVER